MYITKSKGEGLMVGHPNCMLDLKLQDATDFTGLNTPVLVDTGINPISFGPGLFGNALYQTGSSGGHINVPPNSRFNSTNSFTICTWVY